jgi:hypothetical protein
MRGEIEDVGNDDSGQDTQDQNGEKCAKPQGREDAPWLVSVVILDFGIVVTLPGMAVTIHRVPLRVTEPLKSWAPS